MSTSAAHFAVGNYAAAALYGGPDEWQTHAALGLVGKAREAIAGLQRFDHADARFYSAVASWIDGDEATAARLLKNISTAHAKNLLALIRRPKINVLAQLDRGSQWDFITALATDKKFTVQNIGFGAQDLPNKPYADVRKFCDPAAPPDFFVAKLVEWHFIPPNLRELPCPVFGHTADYDIHIQTVHPWLQLFDELIVTDATEWNDVARLTTAPVSAFPKAFGLGPALPPVPVAPRPVDVFVSGTALHPYHPDKAKLLHQLLAMPDLAIKFLNGFVPPAEYNQLLGRTKVGFTYVRHPGATPTRGLETLAMGAAIAVQRESVLRLYLGENEGVLTYDLAAGDLPRTVQRIISRWPEFEQRARRGAEVVRREFALARVASQYFRFLTFLAARPRPARANVAPAGLEQKRSILLKGWVQRPAVHRALREQGFPRWTRELENAASPRPLIDMARELVLEYATAAYPPVARDYSRNFNVRLTIQPELLTQALQLYRLGLERFPRSLVLRFNFIRAALHFGGPVVVAEALALAEQTLQTPAADWEIDVLDDVFPWDFFSQFFNYREYFDRCTAALQQNSSAPAPAPPAGAGQTEFIRALDFSDSLPTRASARSRIRRPGAADRHDTTGKTVTVSAGNSVEEPPSHTEFVRALDFADSLPTRVSTKRSQRSAPASAHEELARLIRASLHYYLSHYTTTDAAHALAAVKLDPGFPFYQLQCARQLVRRGGPADAARAVPVLTHLADQTMLFQQAFALLEKIPTAGRDPQFAALRQKLELARHRTADAGYGVEDWDAIPLRPAPAANSASTHSCLELERPSPAQRDPVESPSRPATRAPRILFLPLEFVEWKYARHLAYPAQLGLEEGLRASGVEFVTLPALTGLAKTEREAWQKQVRRLCAGQHFDQVWLELVHSEWDEEFLNWIATLAPKRVGFIMESLQYDPDVYTIAPKLKQRQAHVEGRLRHVTHAVAVDELDAATLHTSGRAAALWWPQAVPARFICDAAGPAPDARAIFAGALYGERYQFLANRDLQRWLRPLSFSAEDLTQWPVWFDELHRALQTALAGDASLEPGLLAAYLDALREIRGAMFGLWIQSLQEGGAVVNLPSFFKGYAGRVFEAMAAGRPLITWDVADRPRTRKIFAEDEEILFYPKDQPERLAWQIQRLQNYPALAQRLTVNAQRKLQTHHTVEQRVRQILDWVGDGVTPDFNAPVSVTVAQPRPKTQRPAVTTLRPEAADLLLTAGRVALEQNDPAGWESLRQAAALKPAHLPTQLTVAQTALRTDQLAEGKSALEKLLALDPLHGDGLKLLTELCRRQGLFDLAARAGRVILEHAPDALEIYPELTAALLGIGATTGDAGVRTWATALLQSAEARAALCARRPAPDELPAVARLGQLVDAAKLFEQKNFPAAWQATQAAIAARPFHPEAWLLLAAIAQSAGDPARARQCAERARHLAPKWKPAQKLLASLIKHPTAPAVSLPELPEPLRAAGSPPRLSVCLITKNEERFLAQCLRSVRDVAQQIIVVDTGSTDRTVAIAREHGAEVHPFVWVDDFSAARNAALEHATGDWVLILDADEELTESSRAKLRQAMDTQTVMAWRLALVDAGREDEGCSYIPRLFRNAPGLFYTGRVHEQVFTSVETRRQEWQLENRLSEVALLHHGYTEEIVRDRRKVQRNLRLLERTVEEMPGDPNLHMSYGLELVRSGELDAALPQYLQAFRLMLAQPPATVPPELRERLLTLFCTHLLQAGRHEQIIQISGSHLARATGPTASLHFLFGLACIALEKPEEAAGQMRACLAKRDQPALSPIHTDIRKAGPRYCLALCLARLKRWDEAEKAFRAALDEDPTARPLRFDYARLQLNRGRPVEALKQLHELVTESPDDLAAWQLGGQIALSQPEFGEVACDWTAEALKFFPRDPTVRWQRAEALLLHQHVAEALPLWATGQADNPVHRAALMICELAEGQPARSVPSHLEPDVSREFLKWYRRLLDHGAEPVLRRLNERLADWRAALPSAAQVVAAAVAEAGQTVAA